jgi:NAD(P)-dependent dehydrogenase (short-subunit alcohol dehydrogenase family)
MLVNHLGPFLLTGLLLPSMTAGSRIVNVSSRAHFACSKVPVVHGKLTQGSQWW